LFHPLLAADSALDRDAAFEPVDMRSSPGRDLIIVIDTKIVER
jgi:hypothetical protein